MTMARDFMMYKLDLQGLQKVRCDKEALHEQKIILFLWKRKQKSSIRDNFLYTSKQY
jgi:hypothetical protein